MSRASRARLPKTFAARRQELADELEMLASDIRNFELNNAYLWLRSVATRLRKLLVKRTGSNHPLLIELANDRKFPLIVYVSNITIADLRSERDGRPRPLAAIIPNIFSPTYDPWYATAMPLDQAIDLRCFVMGHQEYSFKQVVLDIADTEGAHSDLGRPETLHSLDRIDFSGIPGPYMAVYHLGQITTIIGKRFVEATK